MMKSETVDKIKVAFLDIDGVLNTDKTTRRTTGGHRFVGSRQLKNLKRIITETKAKVVLSSDWRYDRDDPKWNSDYLELRNELARYSIKFYGFTPELPSAHRGFEIAQWLTEHQEVSNFVILDDRTDMEPHKDHWIQTVMARGLGKDETDAAIKILLKG